MEKQKKKTSLKPRIQKAKAKFFASYYSNPAKDLKIIAITGDDGRDTTAHYLQEIIKHHDAKTGLIIDPTTTSSLYRQLSKIWRTGSDHVVISVSSSALANHLFYGLPIFAAVITDSANTAAITTTSTNDSDAKAILFNTQPFFSIISRDNPDFDFYAKYPSKTATLSYGHERSSDLRINHFKLYKKGTEANFTYGTDSFDVATYLTSEAAVSYMAAATLTALAVGVDVDTIVDGIANYEPKN